VRANDTGNRDMTCPSVDGSTDPTGCSIDRRETSSVSSITPEARKFEVDGEKHERGHGHGHGHSVTGPKRELEALSDPGWPCSREEEPVPFFSGIFRNLSLGAVDFVWYPCLLCRWRSKALLSKVE
jgi:hypothetical protein